MNTGKVKVNDKQIYNSTIAGLGQLRLAVPANPYPRLVRSQEPEKYECQPGETRKIVNRLIEYLKEH